MIVENTSCCVVNYQSAYWRDLALPKGIGVSGWWSFFSLIDLRLRPNGKYNTPPVSTMISPIFIPVGVQQIIVITTIDADSDEVRCRFAKNNNECASVCPPDSLPSGTILYSNCTLFITGSTLFDWYAVAVVVEDFIDSTSTIPLSIIPIQFLINVQNKPRCNDRPLLTHVDNQQKQCFGVVVNKPIEIELVAENFCPSTTIIKDIAVLSFSSLVKKSIEQKTPSSWSTLLTWTPTIEQVGSQVLCAIALDSDNTQSNQYCMTFIVVADGIPLCPGEQELTTVVFTSIDHNKEPDVTSMNVNDSSLPQSSSSAEDLDSNSSIPLSSAEDLDPISPISSSSKPNLDSTIPITFSSVCKYSWPWPWLAPVLASLITFLLTSLCCCSDKNRKNRVSQNKIVHQGNIIRQPTRPYKVYNAFERDQHAKQSNHSPVLEKQISSDDARPASKISRVISNPISPVPSIDNNRPRSQVVTPLQAYVFGRRVTPIATIENNNEH
ncbi:unnamed protein product [Adineta steineri]|uniref:Uncharacterized protein n=1 Tax=Adineta steineri TaxID=433720 RepID=A0A814INZ1_9BILA|nr:unnamed protein product [Adineta steineri]CAF1502618.1 unnamed protein product [Adineta steineri]CAF1503014.1 unnamed protein product [Adineta steineri]